MTDTPNAPTPTTPATAEQLREDAALYRRCIASLERDISTERNFPDPSEVLIEQWRRVAASHTRAAAALDAEAARREAGATRPFSLWSRLRTLCAEAAAVDVNGTDYESFSAKLDELALQADDDIVATGLFVTGQLAPKTPATPHAELRGWGAVRPDGKLYPLFMTGEVNDPASILWIEGATAVPVRLTTEGAE